MLTARRAPLYIARSRPSPVWAPVAELVDALELKIEFLTECWFDSGQGHHGPF